MKMDGNDNEEETYIEHLRTLFNELDPEQKGGLNKEELKTLGRKLSLMDSQSDMLLQLSFPVDEKASLDQSDGGHSMEVVNFSKFQESFVAVLSATTDLPMTTSDSEDEAHNYESELQQESEVAPRVVRKGKAYGRRSQPEIQMAEPVHVDPEELRFDVSDIIGDSDNMFHNEYQQLPIRGGGDDGLYFEASGQLGKRISDWQRPKSSQASLIESQFNLSSTSIVMQPRHFFSDLDKNDCGFINFNDLSEFWSREGVTNSKHVLKLLDINIDMDKQINAYELTSSLEDEAKALRLSSADSVVQAVLATFKNHVTYLNDQIEQHHVLLRKMRVELERSELRNSKLVDEADDRYLFVNKNREKLLTEIEQSWRTKLRFAQQNFDQDRELLQNQAMLERDALQQEIDRLMIREGSLRSTIEALQIDNDALEKETKDLVKKLQISESNAAQLQSDLEDLIREKTGSSNGFNPSQEESFAAIIKDYEARCQAANMSVEKVFELVLSTTALSDRNDELVAEVEKLRAEFVQSVKKNSWDGNDNKSSSRKRARHRTSLEYIDKNDLETSEHSDIDAEEIRAEFCNKVADLEKVIQKLQEEKKMLTTRFNEEKTILRGQLESEFQEKLDKERKRMTAFEEMSKSDKKKAINQALADSNKDRDDLEKKLRELKDALQDEQMNTQQSMTNLCREFESDKAEIQAKNDELVQQMRQEIADLQQNLEKEINAHEVTSQQLKTDRAQHKATMQTHSDTISKLEKSAQLSNSNDKEEIKKLTNQLQNYEEQISTLQKDKLKVVADHEVALDLAKAEMHQTVEEMIMKRQQEEQSSLQNELRHMQEKVSDERHQMQQRISSLKEAFYTEAEELKTLVEMEKCELKKALAEESALLKQRLVEEHEKAVEKKRRELDEEEQARFDAQTNQLQEIIENLQSAKIDLEEEVRHLKEDKRELEKQLSNLNSENDANHESFNLQDSLNEKDDVNTVLQSQVSEWRRKHFEVTQELSNVKMRCEEKSAELAQIVKEKQEYADKITSLENDKSNYQVQNARLLSRNIDLGAHDDERMAEEHEKRIVDMRKRLEEQDALCEELREKLKKYLAMEDAANTVKTLSQTDMKTKYEATRHQLIQQMNKTKDMYSKLSRSESLIKDLYCENADLMRSLQVTEDKCKASERKVAIEVDKNNSLTLLLRKICPEAV